MTDVERGVELTAGAAGRYAILALVGRWLDDIAAGGPPSWS